MEQEKVSKILDALLDLGLINLGVKTRTVYGNNINDSGIDYEIHVFQEARTVSGNIGSTTLQSIINLSNTEHLYLIFESGHIVIR
jgi:hypothetical protein